MLAEDFHKLLRSRRSVRKFDDRKISAGILNRILESAIWAANSHNRQAWAFVHLESMQSRQAIVDAMNPHYVEALKEEGLSIIEAERAASKKNGRIITAPVAILLCLDNSRLDNFSSELRSQGEKTIATQSLALAGGNILNTAHAEGLGAVWVCAPLFKPVEVGQALKLEAHLEPQAIILLGYPAMPPKQKTRRKLDQVVIKR
jgi:coenzyme F420-0:L-glutamate ligase/coenzyme F420-1:gamma-L-glutamate ligase